MKRYHLADVLTLCEVIAGVILLGMAWFQVPIDYALWIFSIGELCDACDGPCSRRWPYPSDNVYRFWRAHVELIEHVTDGFLYATCAIYLICQPVTWIRYSALIVGIFLAVFCLITESRIRHIRFGANAGLKRKRLILQRRWVYDGGIAVFIGIMIWGAKWVIKIKIALSIFGIICGLALIIWKLDRALNP